MGMPDRLKDGEKGAAVLYSGGMDSTVIVAHLLHQGYTVYPIAMDDGSLNYNLRRKVAIEMSLQKLGILNRLVEMRVPNPEPLRIDRTTFGFVPGYKLIMILAAMSACQILNVDRLYMGYNMDNQRGGYLDEGRDFMEEVSSLYHRTYAMEDNTEFPFQRRIEVLNPYFDMEKYEMVILGEKLGVDFSLTISCRQVQVGAGLVHCGSCEVCRRRRDAFICAETTDTTLWVPSSPCGRNVAYQQESDTPYPVDKLRMHLNRLFSGPPVEI